MDLKGLTRGEAVAGGAAIALIIISVIPLWGSVSFEGTEEGTFGLWDGGVFGNLPKFAAFLELATIVLILLKATGAMRSIPTVTYLALGLTATLLMLMGVAVGPGFGGGGLSGIEETRGPFLYAGAVLCAVTLFGGWLHLRGEDTDGFGNRSAAPPPM